MWLETEFESQELQWAVMSADVWPVELGVTCVHCLISTPWQNYCVHFDSSPAACSLMWEKCYKSKARSTLGKLPNVSLIVDDEMDPCRRVHDRTDAADAGELQEGVGDAGASSSRESVQGLQKEIQTAQLQELDHPCLVAAFQATLQPRVVDHGGHLQQPDAQLWISALQVGLQLGVWVLRGAQAAPDCRPFLFPVWLSGHDDCGGQNERISCC